MVDWIIGIGIFIAFVAVAGKKVRDIRAGRPGCGCGCPGCSKRGKCH
ncbi:MAG: FeoB-associated Cys-rich membrane protein [Lachnospiraceae bacterium]|nr:FeoB-associated Cys-rich membrane protein [Lachnospiraceae bacterium]